MRFFKKGQFYLEGISPVIPADAVALTDEQYADFLESINNGGMIGTNDKGYPIAALVKLTPEQKYLEQYSAIDAFVSKLIKEKYDYDSFEETRAWYDSPRFAVESRRVNAWCCACFEIQADIKLGLVVFDSVDDAIAALPAFEILV